MFVFAPIRWALRIVMTVVLGIVAYLIVSGVQVYLAARATPTAPPVGTASDAIVVYAAATSSGLDRDLTARLTEARTLYVTRLSRRVIVAGPSQGVGLRDSVSWLTSHGLASADVQSEAARSLGAALKTLAPTLGANARVTIVTDSVDALVDRADASSAGFSPDVVALPSDIGVSDTDPGAVFRQASALAAGRVIGIARIPWSRG